MFGRNKKEEPMAEATPAAKPADDQAGAFIAPNEVLGIVQRHLQELLAYCSQHPAYVDPMVCRAVLERTFGWVTKLPELPPPSQAEQNGSGKPAEKRAN